MKNFSDILLVSDVDGTFLSGEAEGLNKNLDAIGQFKKMGGLFTFATGRDLNSLSEVIPNAAQIVNAPMITSNGARVYDFDIGEYIYDCPVKNKALLAEIAGQIYKLYPETGIRFSCENNLAIPKFNKMLKHDLKDISLEKLRVMEINLDELIISEIKIYKCVIVNSPETLEEIRQICKEYDKNNELFFSKSYLTGLEAVDKHGTKGHAALFLKKHTGNNRRLAAAGDYENDITMLKMADIAAAPENAPEQVKTAAHVITADCKSGAIYDFINNKL